MRTLRIACLVVGLLALVPRPASSCSLCSARLRAMLTLREESQRSSARVIAVGTVSNPRLVGGGDGASDLQLEHVIRSPAGVGRKTLTIPRYLPVSNPKDPPRFLVYGDVQEGKVDTYRGVPLKRIASADYVKKALARAGSKDTVANLRFFFDYLEDADPVVSLDAFLEFAKAGDADVARVGPSLKAARLRSWLANDDTQAERLGLYAMLLGACGRAEDRAFLEGLLKKDEERFVNAADGIVAGLIHLDPKAGWSRLEALLRDGRNPLPRRLALVRTIQFYHGARPIEARGQIVGGLRAMIDQGELADLAVEYLRRWRLWDLTPQVLALEGRRGFDSALYKRALVRYALSCPATPATRAFVARQRAADSEMVEQVEEQLKLERMP